MKERRKEERFWSRRYAAVRRQRSRRQYLLHQKEEKAEEKEVEEAYIYIWRRFSESASVSRQCPRSEDLFSLQERKKK